MKFFLISNMYPSTDSPGYGVFVKNIVDGLADNGIDMETKAVILGKPNDKWSKIRKYLGFYYAILKGFFKKYDFIYVHFPNQAVPLLKILYKFRQPKMIINFHGEDLLYSESGSHKWLGQTTETFCREYATGIVVPSPYFSQIVDDRRLIGREKIIVSASGGINKDYFAPKKREKVVSEADNIIKLGYIGRLDPGKGALEFLFVLRRLWEMGENFKATLIGYGTLYEEAVKFISENNLRDYVTVIPGVPQSELPEYYKSLDLLLFLSSQESLGLAGIESLACGVPVIGSNAGGIISYLEDEKNGYVIPDISDTNFIVDVIKKYSSLSQEKKLEMYENAVATGMKYYSDDVCRQLSVNLVKIIEGK